MGFKWPEAVLIQGPDTVAGYAPQIEDEALVSWQEGGHRRFRLVDRVLTDEPDRFHFEGNDGGVYDLRPLTLELYEQHVREHTVGKPAFKTEREMLDAMRREW